MTATSAPSPSVSQILAEYAAGPGANLRALYKKQDGSWSDGFAVVRPKPIQDGMEVTVYLAHREPNETVKLSLRGVLNQPDGFNQYPTREIWLSPVISAGNPTPADGRPVFETVHVFRFTKAEIDAYIARHAPQAPGLALQPGTRLAVSADWYPASHQWGGFERHGSFAYQPAGAPAVGARAVQRGGSGQWDLSEPYDHTLRANYWPLDVKGAVSLDSHIEAEVKARVPPEKFRQAYDRLMLLVRPRDASERKQREQALKSLFGEEWKKWKVKPVDKFWVKAPNGDYATDALGYIEVKAFTDVYLDNQARDLASRQIAVRARSVQNEQLGYTNWNIKPGPGVFDPGTNASRRIEIQMPARADVSANELRRFLSSEDEPLNPWLLVQEYAPELRMTQPKERARDLLAPGLLLTGWRYKVELEHDSGVAVELSLDLGLALGLDENGMPLRRDARGKPDPGGQLAVAVLSQLEMELNHPPLKPTRAQAPAGPRSSSALAADDGAAPDRAERLRRAELRGLPKEAALVSTRRTHVLADLSHPAITDDAGFKTFSRVVPGLQEFLLGGKVGADDGAMPTIQKAAAATRIAGLLAMTPEEQALYASERKLSEAVRPKVSAALDPVLRRVEPALQTALQRADRDEGNERTARDPQIRQLQTVVDQTRRELAAIEREMARTGLSELAPQAAQLRARAAWEQAQVQNAQSFVDRRAYEARDKVLAWTTEPALAEIKKLMLDLHPLRLTATP